MAINLPYNLREGQVAYAKKVMANFLALLGSYNNVTIGDLGTGDLDTMLQLLSESMVRAKQQGNAEDIVFADGDSVEQKFAAGTLNASVFNSEGLFYFHINPADGHLYVTTAESINEGDFAIDDQNGHLTFTLDDPATGNEVHTYDLGKVTGKDDRVLGYYDTLADLEEAVPNPEPGDKYGVGTEIPYQIYTWNGATSDWLLLGQGVMDASVYDPLNQQKDMNWYTGVYNVYASGWGDYFLTYDETFSGSKTYYTYNGVQYSEATVTAGDTIPINIYYEKLPDTDCLITDDRRMSGATLTGHITSTTGHAIVGLNQTGNTDAKRREWINANVVGWRQGAGRSEEAATNKSSYLRLRALGTVPDTSIVLVISMYL